MKYQKLKRLQNKSPVYSKRLFNVFKNQTEEKSNINKKDKEKLFETFVYRIIMKGPDFDVISFKPKSPSQHCSGGISFVFA